MRPGLPCSGSVGATMKATVPIPELGLLQGDYTQFTGEGTPLLVIRNLKDNPEAVAAYRERFGLVCVPVEPRGCDLNQGGMR